MAGEKQLFIIGLDTYSGTRFKPLDNAVLDAKKFAKKLTEKYGFIEVGRLLNENATRRKIIDELNNVCKGNIVEDELIIYFAGHGFQDPTSKAGFWIPLEGKDEKSTWINNESILEIIRGCAAKHILLISDSCFSGTFTTDERGTLKYDTSTLESLGSRWILTSGREENVNDGKSGEGSPFSRTMCDVIEENQTEAISIGEVFLEIQERMDGRFIQQATYSAYKVNGHHWGQVVLRISSGSKERGARLAHIPYTTFPLPEVSFPAYHIKRSIGFFENKPHILHGFDFMVEKFTLMDEFQKEKRIVILGTDGSGKSMELLETARQLQNARGHYIPIYLRFNTYVDQDVDKLLPKGWQGTKLNRLILLCDGLDEVQMDHANTARRKILAFSEDNPEIRMVLSCRTNFYDLPDGKFRGTIAGFKVYRIHDITLQEAASYAREHFSVDDKKFISEVNDNGLQDLIGRPFFLEILIKTFKKEGVLFRDRSKIMKEALLTQYSNSLDHFNSVIRPPLTHPEIVATLTRIAFVMEAMGRNYLDDYEVYGLFFDPGIRERIKCMPAFNRNNATHQWQFDHNNLQEFLAGVVLQHRSYEKVLEAITLPGLERVKPTWSNTLSFYISTGPDHIVDKVVEWVKMHDPEFVVRFENDIVADDKRDELAWNVFENYNIKGILMVSNKFSDEEFAAFSFVRPFVLRLLKILEDSNTAWINKINAMRVIHNYNPEMWDDLSARINKALLRILREDKPSDYFIYLTLSVLGHLRKLEGEPLESLIDQYRLHKNEYIRAGLYKIIMDMGRVDDYISVYLDGFDLNRIESAVEDRQHTNLMDEEFLWAQALKKIKRGTSLKLVFPEMERALAKKRIYDRDSKDVFNSLLDKAVELNSSDRFIFESVYTLWRFAGRTYEEYLQGLINPFFEQTENKGRVFWLVFCDSSIGVLDKLRLIGPLVDGIIIDQIVDASLGGGITDDEVRDWYDALIHHGISSGMTKEMIDEFEARMNLASGLQLQRPTAVNWSEIYAVQYQESFDLLFNHELFKQEIARIFKAVGKPQINQSDLSRIRSERANNRDDYIPFSAINFIRGHLFNDNALSELEVIDLCSGPGIEERRLQNIYRILHLNGYPVTVSEDQRGKIVNWVEEYMNMTDLERLAMADRQMMEILWYFFGHFKLKISNEKLMSFTIVCSFRYQGDLNEECIIDELSKIIPRDELQNRVLANMEKVAVNLSIWIENAGYALRKKMRTAYPIIIEFIVNANGEENGLIQLLKLLFKQVRPIEDLKRMALCARSQSVKEEAISLLMDESSQKEFLLAHLNTVLTDKSNDLDMRVFAANKLIVLKDINGLEFIVDSMDHDKLDRGAFSKILDLNKLESPEAIPLLLQLLYNCKSQEESSDPLHFLESKITDGLFNIAVQSAETFKIAKELLLEFQRKNAPQLGSLDYLSHWINKMEHQLLINCSRNLTLKEAIAEYDRFSSES
jgi:hypothetical protein